MNLSSYDYLSVFINSYSLATKLKGYCKMNPPHLFTFTDCTFTSATAQEAGGSLDSERVRDIRQSDIRSIDL